jgi:integrase
VIRQFFEEFKDMEIISRNPFRKIRSAGNSDPSRKVYVAKEVAQYFFENCPDYQTKMLNAVARMAGLRIPSDIIMLKFEDIDF